LRGLKAKSKESKNFKNNKIKAKGLRKKLERRKNN
jgi:hypothetical protein